MSVIDDGARIFVGGQFRPAEASTPVVEAATGTLLGAGAAASPDEVDAAVAAAGAALPSWSATPRPSVPPP